MRSIALISAWFYLLTLSACDLKVSQNPAVEGESANIASPIHLSQIEVQPLTTTTALVTWNSDLAADSEIDYGISSVSEHSPAPQPALQNSHSVMLSSLNAGVTYYYRLRSISSSGAIGQSKILSFTQPALPSAPKISGVKATLQGTSVTIVWTTDVASSSQIAYGSTRAYGQTTTLVSTLVTTHSQTINNLTLGATYHFRVMSVDSFNQMSNSADSIFGPHRLSRLLLNSGIYPYGGNVVPLVGDMDGDGQEDAVFYFPNTGQWTAFQVNQANPGKSIPLSGPVNFAAPAVRSYGLLGYLDGDLIADRVVYYPDTGEWKAALSNSNTVIDLGQLPKIGGVPFLADLTGEGYSSQVLYYPADGTWDYLLNPRCKPETSHSLFSGNPVVPGWAPGDIALMGSLNNNGVADRILVRSATLTWLSALTGTANTYNFGDPIFNSTFGNLPAWGRANWAIPFMGDVNGVGISDRLIYTPPDRLAGIASSWGVSFSNPTFAHTNLTTNFGATQTIPLVGDFFGSGQVAIGFYDPTVNVFTAQASNGGNSVRFTPAMNNNVGPYVQPVCLGRYADTSGSAYSAQTLQSCLDSITSNGSLSLPAGTYRVNAQIVISRAITVTTAAIAANTACFTPPLTSDNDFFDPNKGAVNINGVTNANPIACARLYADDHFFQVAPPINTIQNDIWGMVYVNGNISNAAGSRLQNVVFDHIIFDGNGLNREAAWAATGQNASVGPCRVNSSGCGNLMFWDCDHCAIQNSVSMRVPAPLGTTFALSFNDSDAPTVINNLFWKHGHIDFDSQGNTSNGHAANAFQIWAYTRPSHNVLVKGNFSVDATDGGLCFQSEGQEMFGEVANNYVYQINAIQPSSGILLNVGNFSPAGNYSHGYFGNGALADPSQTLWVHNNFVHGDKNNQGLRKITLGIELGAGPYNGFTNQPVPISAGQAAVLAGNPIVNNFIRVEGARIDSNLVVDARIGINDDAAGVTTMPTYIINNTVATKTGSSFAFAINKASQCTNAYNPLNDPNGNPYSYLADRMTLKPSTINPGTAYDQFGYLLPNITCVIDPNYSTTVVANPGYINQVSNGYTLFVQMGDYSAGKGIWGSNTVPVGWNNYDTSRWQAGAAFGFSPGFPRP